jgi:UDP-N-acetylmuramoyl-L-alanyl-D-glutamate--2,6-diaminopimelate ligase
MSRYFKKLKNILHASQGILAELQYGFPYRKLKFIAVTGTDGKTTTIQLIHHILEQSGIKAAYISTISAKIDGKYYDTGFHVTSPDPWVLPKFLKIMVDKKTEFVVLETTSQGLEQKRTALIPFDSSVITNIKSDHLDYHGTWENYAKAKYIIVKKTKNNGLVVLNKDDKESAVWLNQKLINSDLRNKMITWISSDDISGFKQSIDGLGFIYQKQDFFVPLIGRFNITNILAAIKITQKYLPLDKIARSLRTFETPKGRMEVICKSPKMVIIDFAHTPNALENALNAVKEVLLPGGKIICVYGCAGERDKNRRMMGAVSAKLADITILTAEDPRDEKLIDVNTEIFGHAEKEGALMAGRFRDNKAYRDFGQIDLEKIRDKIQNSPPPLFFAFDEDGNNSRVDAIDFALKIARPQDIVFLTGKAHEQSLAFGGIEYPWSEHDTVRKLLHNVK